LSSEALAKGKNFLMSLPTSAGKSLIAEVMLLRCVSQIRKKAILVLPYVCLVVEKEDALEKLFESTGNELQSFYGSKGRIPLSSEPFVGVATIEKGNSIINSLIEENRLQELALVVIDEIHMLSEAGNGLHRGALIESMICKLKAFAPHVQIIGMSATIPNADQVASFMQAQFSFWQFRPVKLVNRLQIRNSLISSDCTQIRSLPSSESLELIPGMLLEVLPHSVLVFCPTRSGEPPSMLHFLGCF
jgi:replicative superfamily II helicase